MLKDRVIALAPPEAVIRVVTEAKISSAVAGLDFWLLDARASAAP